MEHNVAQDIVTGKTMRGHTCGYQLSTLTVWARGGQQPHIPFLLAISARGEHVEEVSVLSETKVW
jgi:hypothetical protein